MRLPHSPGSAAWISKNATNWLGFNGDASNLKLSVRISALFCGLNPTTMSAVLLNSSTIRLTIIVELPTSAAMRTNSLW